MRNIYIMSGIPGSGKSTYIRQHAPWGDFHVSRDDFRAYLRRLYKCEDKYFPCGPDQEWKLWTAHLGNILTQFPRDDVYIDQTTLTQKAAAKLLRSIKQYITNNDQVFFIIIHTSLNVCLERNAVREGYAGVPDETIKSMHDSMFRDPIRLEVCQHDFPGIYFGLCHENCMEN